MSTMTVNICLIESVEPTWRWFGVLAENEEQRISMLTTGPVPVLKAVVQR